ncbi:MAG TPA: GspH/FimT family pseudopilin [Pseudomonadales bacterium]|nr:GspH/FimT family pseudopilin [Pseudomonadales bacterium]
MSDEAMSNVFTRIPRQRGITIIEIMVSLAIAAVLIGLALPAFNSFVAQRTLTAQVNDFLVALQYARSEAGRQGTNVGVIAANPATATNEWGPGWCVMLVPDPNNPPTCPNPPDATSLRSFDSLGANTLDAVAGANTFDGVGVLAFSPNGLLTFPKNATGVFHLCNPKEHIGREISLNTIGRVASRTPPVAQLDCAP